MAIVAPEPEWITEGVV